MAVWLHPMICPDWLYVFWSFLNHENGGEGKGQYRRYRIKKWKPWHSVWPFKRFGSASLLGSGMSSAWTPCCKVCFSWCFWRVSSKPKEMFRVFASRGPWTWVIWRSIDLTRTRLEPLTNTNHCLPVSIYLGKRQLPRPNSTLTLQTDWQTMD